jgi:hypothetical protein
MAKRKLTTGQRIIYKTLHKNIGRILVFVDNFGIAVNTHVLCSSPQVFWTFIGGVMASVLASSEVDRGFGQRSGKTKDYKIGICCFSTKHTVLRNKSKDWLARN